MLRACQGFSVRVAHHLEKQQTRHGNLFLPSLPRRYTNKVVRWVSKPTGLFRGGQCPRQASQLVALPRDLPNRASGSISPLFGRLPPPKPSAARVAQAINTYRPGSKKRRATQRRHPSQMPGPPGKRWDATPTSTTPPQPQPCDPEAKTQHSARHGHTPPPPPALVRWYVVAEPTFFADSFRYSMPPYTTTPQVPGPLRRESASHHMVLRTTSAR